MNTILAPVAAAKSAPYGLVFLVQRSYSLARRAAFHFATQAKGNVAYSQCFSYWFASA